MSAFVRVLARAPAAVLGEELGRLASDEPGDIAAGRDDAAQAMARVLSLMQVQGRRERELSALYATARSLAALRGRDEVFTTVVQEAHGLMASDFTYLSMFDDDHRSLTLCAWAGVISPEFRAAEVPGRTGVAGKVLETRAPYWVRDYLQATDITHDAEFDVAVEKEGLKSLLGVPLVAGQQIFGILYAAYRNERPFAREEAALLSAFADHAAVAMENARLYDESRKAVRELEAAYGTIEAHVAAMERSAGVHEALTKLVLAGGGATDVANLLATSLAGGIGILDREDEMIVVSGDLDPAEVTCSDQPPSSTFDHEGPLGPAMEESRRTGRAVTTQREGTRRMTLTALFAGDQYLGAMVLAHDRQLHPADVRTFERAGQITGLLTLMQDALAEAEARVRGELLVEVLTSRHPFAPELHARARTRKVDLERLNAIFVVDAGPERTNQTIGRLRTIAREWDGLAGEHLRVATLLAHADDVASAAEELHRRLRYERSPPVLVCGAAAAPDELGRAFVRASRCARVARQLGWEDRATTTEDLGLYAMVFDPERGQDLARFIQDALGPVVAYDDRRHTELVKTLGAYFANAGHLTRTAAALHVHMNTLLKRLDRIGALLGSDWQEPDNVLSLHLAVRMRELASTLGQDTAGAAPEESHTRSGS